MDKVGIAFLMLLTGFVFSGCESSKAVTATPAEQAPSEEEASAEVEEIAQTEESAEAEATAAEEKAFLKELVQGKLSELELEAREKHRLASQLLDFAGPIEDLSSESTNVRWLAAELLNTAIELDPTEFDYYKDLFLTYMVLQEPIKALEAIEPARNTPALKDEVVEFQSLVFGALEFAHLIDSET